MSNEQQPSSSPGKPEQDVPLVLGDLDTIVRRIMALQHSPDGGHRQITTDLMFFLLGLGLLSEDPGEPQDGLWWVWQDSPTTAKGRMRVDGVTYTIFGGAGPGSITLVVDAGTSVITTGFKGAWRVPRDGMITKATLLSTDAAVTSGSIVVDVWKDTFANYPPTVADSICAAAKPTLASAVKSEDAVLTGWDKDFVTGDIFGFNVDSVTDLKRIALIIDFAPV